MQFSWPGLLGSWGPLGHARDQTDVFLEECLSFQALPVDHHHMSNH